MDSWINLDLLGNPVNWLIVSLTLIFGAYAIMLIMQNLGVGTLPIVALSK